MNKRTKFYIGIALVISAVTTTCTFIALCFKKKSAIAALIALAAAEGVIGLALIEDNNFLKRKKAVAENDMFDLDDIDLSQDDIDSELSFKNDGEGSSAPILDFEVPKDDEASEEDFI